MSRRRHVLTAATACAAAVVPVFGAVHTASAAVASTPASYARDTFSRTLTSGWGTADTGGRWRVSSLATFAVHSAAGSAILRGASTAQEALLSGVAVADAQETLHVTPSALAGGTGETIAAVLRSTAAGEYRLRLRLANTGAAYLSASKLVHGVETPLGTEAQAPGIHEVATAPLTLHAQVAGGVLSASVLPQGAPVTSTWQWQVTDAAPLSGVGTVGVAFAVGATPASSGSTTFTVDNLSVRSPAGSVPPPPPPPPGPGALPVGQAHYPVPSNAIYVAPPAGSGGAASPAAASGSGTYSTVQAAVDAAPDGSTVVLRGGIYHESVTVPYQKSLTIENYPGEAVWFDGSRVLTAWTADGGAWRTPWSDTFDRTPSQSAVDPTAPYAAWPEQVFVDGTQITQVGSRSAVVPGTFYYDTTNHLMWIGSDPTGHELRSSDLTDALYVNRGANSAVRGIGFRRYATPDSDMGAVKLYADGATLDNCVITDMATTGLSVNGTGISITNSTINNSGKLGIQAHWADGLIVDSDVITNNNSQLFHTIPVAGGFKITQSRHLTVAHNLLTGNHADALWFDESTEDDNIYGNTLINNGKIGIHVEISAIGVIADNTIIGCPLAGIQIVDTSQIRVYNNTLINNARHIDVMDGPRVWTDPTVPGHDPRYPNDPPMTWITAQITLRNNVLSGSQAGTVTLLQAEDINRARTGNQMVSADNDAYYRPSASAPRWLIDWANYPSNMSVPTTLAAFAAQWGMETHGTERVGAASWVDPATGALLDTAGLPAPVALPTDIAALLGNPTVTTVGALPA